MKVKKLKPEAIIPSYKHKGDAGMDLCTLDEGFIYPGETRLFSTGFAIELPEGLHAEIRSRSGLSIKHGIAVVNAPGTIDNGYKGEIKVGLINLSRETYKVKKGDRIAQMVIMPYIQVKIKETNNLSKTDRNTDGFGSTGR